MRLTVINIIWNYTAESASIMWKSTVKDFSNISSISFGEQIFRWQHRTAGLLPILMTVMHMVESIKLLNMGPCAIISKRFLNGEGVASSVTTGVRDKMVTRLNTQLGTWMSWQVTEIKYDV